MSLMTKAQILNLERYRPSQFRSFRIQWVDLIAYLCFAVICGGVGGFVTAMILYHPETITGG